MKRAAFILVLALSLTLTAGKSFAQRALPGMRGLELRSGMVDGWYSSSPSSATGYYFGLAMSLYSKNANKWVYGVEYLNRGYPYKSERIPMAQFTGEGGYYFNKSVDKYINLTNRLLRRFYRGFSNDLENVRNSLLCVIILSNNPCQKQR